MPEPTAQQTKLHFRIGSDSLGPNRNGDVFCWGNKQGIQTGWIVKDFDIPEATVEFIRREGPALQFFAYERMVAIPGAIPERLLRANF